MALKATKAEVWAVSIDDRAGGVADKLDPLAKAGANFEMVFARRTPENPGKGMLFVTPIKGVKALPFSQLRSGFPVLGNPANKKRTVSLTAKQFRYSFGNAISEAESDTLFEAWTIPGPGRPLFEDAGPSGAGVAPAITVPGLHG